MPRSRSWRSVASTMRTVSVVAATVLGPWRSGIVTRTIVVARTIPLLFPWSHIADGRRAVPRPHVVTLVMSTLSSFDTARSFAITRRCIARKFLHELLKTC